MGKNERKVDQDENNILRSAVSGNGVTSLMPPRYSEEPKKGHFIFPNEHRRQRAKKRTAPE